MTISTLKNGNVHHDVTLKSDLEIIIDMMKKDSKVTTKQLAMTIGKSVRTVQRIIAACSKITFVDKNQNGHWEIED